MKTIHFRIIATSLLLLASVISRGQTPKGIKVEREDDFIKISYTLDKDATDVKLSVSSDGGKTYSLLNSDIFGDLGIVLAGDRAIYWELPSQLKDVPTSSLIFKVSNGPISATSGRPSFSEIAANNNLQSNNNTVATNLSARYGFKNQPTGKRLFQLEVMGGVGVTFPYFEFGCPFKGSIGLLLIGNRSSNYFGVNGCYFLPIGCDDLATIELEYRHCKKNLQGLWWGGNIGVEVCHPLPSIHLLGGYQVTKWFNLRLEAGYPDISFSLCFNIPNLFYK